MSAGDAERPVISSPSSCVVAMPPSAPHGRVTWSRSASRLSSVLPRSLRRGGCTTTLPPARQPLLAVAGDRAGSPYNPRHWYDPSYSRTLPWNGCQRSAARQGTSRTPEPRQTAVDARNGGWWYGQCNGGPGRRRATTTTPDDRHSTDRLDVTWTDCADVEADSDHITGRFSWSLACLQDLENGNDSAVQSLMRPVVEDDDDRETLDELNDPSSTTVGS